MVESRHLKFWIVSLLASATACVAAGYGTAHLSVARCISQTQARLAANPKVGYGMRPGKVVVGAESVSGAVSGPFSVTAHYLVPFDLHGTVYSERFRALPWNCRLIATESVEL